ncbi:hypothetical protein [Streptomyces canus]|uniref:hypothetical protein n=1 Tax=Streptomyces canus TaxID=58343 RepID=UPI00386B7628
MKISAASGGRLRMPARCATGDSYGPSTSVLAAVTTEGCAVLAAATGSRPELGVWLVLVPVGVLLVTVGFAVGPLPDVVTLPLAVIMLGQGAVAGVISRG